MRAIVARGPGGPEVLELREVADPVPGPGELLLRVAATAVNRADLLQREGRYPPPPGASELIGLEASGTVAAVGAGADGWAVGDRAMALLAGGGSWPCRRGRPCGCPTTSGWSTPRRSPRSS
jgi:NADPH:quinone reductase-like Zn-dependent oxidoreductase